MKGYAGKITFVDLTSGEIRDEKLGEEFARKFLGGNGFAAMTLFDLVPGGADPLGPENAFIVCTGPLTGTLAHGSGRAGIVTKSPLTGCFMDSYFGGDFGARLKQSGRDMIVIQGRSRSPVALFLDDERASLVPADDLWGLSTKDAQDRLVERLGEGISSLCCGPAGENLVPIACCIGGRRAAGRGGTGAVLGSKNLKAISVRGTGDITVADMKGLLKFNRETKEKFLGLEGLINQGTSFIVDNVNDFGGLGTRNWQEETWKRAGNINAARLIEDHFVRHWACFACGLGGCTKVARTVGTPSVMTEGPEYETLFALGSNCGVDDLDRIIEADRLCEEYGIDTISFGGAVAFVMECFQRGLLTTSETGGIDFSFGKGETLVACVPLVAERSGIGDLLARGVRALAREVGQGSEAFACHVKGLEPPGHSARALKSMGLGYAVSPRGGSHHDARPGPEYGKAREERSSTDGKATFALGTADWTAVGDSMIICRFFERAFGLGLDQVHSDLINRTVGWEMGVDELKEIAERVQTVERCFNCREGMRRKDDRLPRRFTDEEIPSGKSKGLRTKPEELQVMLDEYYEKRGWDADGVPTRETLERLGLEDLSGGT